MSLTDYESEVQLILIVALVGALVLAFWHFLITNTEPTPITIENVPVSEPASSPAGDSGVADKTTGQFVASKNGTRYYPLTCAGAKRIKDENKIYFQTTQDAEKRGLKPAANCP